MTQAVLESVESASNNGTPAPERKRKKMVALKAIALQLGVPNREIEEWCDRQSLEIIENSRAELEVDIGTMEQFVRQWRGYQAQKQAELDIAILSSSQPVTISTDVARELGLMNQGTQPEEDSKPDVSFTLRNVKKGKNIGETLQAVIRAQPEDKQHFTLETLRSGGKEGVRLRERILKNIYGGKGATEIGLFRAAQKLEEGTSGVAATA